MEIDYASVRQAAQTYESIPGVRGVEAIHVACDGDLGSRNAADVGNPIAPFYSEVVDQLHKSFDNVYSVEGR